MKVHPFTSSVPGHHGWTFECPGCGFMHAIDERWTFNGNTERPTFTPSLLLDCSGCSSPHQHIRCHSFITDGRIQFLGDSTHKLSGQTVDLPEFEE